ncbi:MAG: hypothetical protein M1835_003110 [Candelina submexicana]|nr:MAG: hypothetical protein M1835_003110 [Candelina submexicana]
MMKATLLLLTQITAVLAHMQLTYPPPFAAENNPHRTDPADEHLDYPYNCCGRQDIFPCRGYLKLLGTPQGASVASWPAGSQQNFNMSGIGNHYGGSCQVSFSVDQGKTFLVAKSYEGNCPHRNQGNDAGGQNFDFTVPADINTGDVIFAWTWFNREQEFYMNCAAVTITPGTGAGAEPAAGASPSPVKQAPTVPSSTYSSNGCACTCTQPPAARALLQHKRAGGVNVHHRRADPVPFSKRPGILVADIGNGCLTARTTAEVKYPNPGPDVVQGDGEYPLSLPLPPDKCGYA